MTGRVGDIVDGEACVVSPDTTERRGVGGGVVGVGDVQENNVSDSSMSETEICV